MHLDRERFLLFAAALAACHHSSADAPSPADSTSASASASGAATKDARLDASASATLPAATDAAVASSGSADAGVTGAASCAALIAENETRLAHPAVKCTGFEKDEPTVRAALAKTAKGDFFHYCHRGENGTWAVMVVSAKLAAPTGEAGGCGWAADYQLVFQSDSNADVRAGLASAKRSWNQFPDDTSEVSEPRPFDYDGDHHDELIVATTSWENGDGDHTKVEVLTTDAKGVVPYKVPFPYDGVVDADKDGRPDLLEGSFFASDALICGLGTHTAYGAPLLLHSLPDGTFSRTDDVARRWAVTKCPSANATTDDCALGASCLRLWGSTPQQVGAWMQAKSACHQSCGDGDLTAAGVAMTKAALPFDPLSKNTPQPIRDAKIYTNAPVQD